MKGVTIIIKRIIEIIFIIFILVSSFYTAVYYRHTHLSKNEAYYHILLEPAVLITCGRGFNSISNLSDLTLFHFLTRQTDHFNCHDLPKKLEVRKNSAHYSIFYLIHFVALVWSITGIKWSAITLIVALMFSLSVLAIYGINRLILPPLLSLMGAGIFLFYKESLISLLSYRDYCKVPFILGAIWIIGLLVLKTQSKTKQFILTVLLALLTGIGYGFRTDILVILPYTLVCFIFFLPTSYSRKALFNYFCLFCYFGIFFVLAWPIFQSFNTKEISSCIWHFPLAGSSPGYINFYSKVSPLYGWGYTFIDQMIYVMVNIFAIKVLHLNYLTPCSFHYDTAAKHLLYRYISIFPADYLIRIYNSVIYILQRYYSFISTIILLLVLVIIDIRLCLFLLFSICYIFSYPSILFDIRHYFYLSFWGWIPFGLLIYYLSLFAFNADNRKQYFDLVTTRFQNTLWIKKSLLKMILLFILVFAPNFILLHQARKYQNGNVSHLITTYLKAPYVKIDVKKYPLTKNITRYQFLWDESILTKVTHSKQQPFVDARILRLRLGGKNCLGKTINFRIAYHVTEYQGPLYDYTQTLNIPLKQYQSNYMTVFIPLIFSAGDISPQGVFAHGKILEGYGYPFALDIENKQQVCLNSIALLDEKITLPIWISLFIPDAWHNMIKYHSFIDL